MPTLTAQQTRIQLLLQEVDTTPTRQQQIAVAHQESLAQLARGQTFGEIVPLNVIAGQAQYTLPDATVDIVTVLYNERRLDSVRETQLDRWVAGWEALQGDPEYYTTSLQAPNVIRLVPQPVRSGSAVPDVDTSPLILPTEDNLVVFVTTDVASQCSDPADTVPCRAGYEDWLVFETTRALASREVETQDLALAQLCTQLADLWMGLLKGTPRG